MKKAVKDTVVSINYKLYDGNKDGELIEEVSKDKPFVFLFGAGFLLPKFEENLEGKEVGENFSFNLEADEAYSEYSEENIVELPKNIFEENDEVPSDEILFEGNMVPMEDEEGNPLTGIIKEIKDDTIMMDFNHPMAGKNLYFEGSIVDVREATEEELAHGHHHDEHGHQHDENCGC